MSKLKYWQQKKRGEVDIDDLQTVLKLSISCTVVVIMIGFTSAHFVLEGFF